MLAGFQANAAAKLVVIQTGDSLPSVGTRPGPADGYSNERGGYAALIANTPNKLVFENGVPFYRSGAPQSTDKTQRATVDVDQTGTLITFADADGKNPMTLTYNGTDYKQFSVFRQTIGAAGNNLCVPDYYHTDVATAPNQQLSLQDFNDGSFEGFLAVNIAKNPNTNINVDAGSLVIAVHNRDGVISLIPYSDYVTSLGTDLTKTTATNQYYPLYVKTQDFGGRWATPADFTKCKFYTIPLVKGTDGSSDGLLTVYSAAEVAAGTKNKAYQAFAIQQVDYIQNSTNITNLIGNAAFQGKDHDSGSTNAWNYGTYTGSGVNDVIPLFRLASPEDSCKVLSISRQDDMFQQNQQPINGVAGNKLELRKYGDYYRYDGANNSYVSHSTTCGTAAYATYTSLQKFAIWIDEDGNMTLYPVAAYSWQIGNDPISKQPDALIPNSVLIYNDINVKDTSPSDKAYGVQIGYWNGKVTSTTTAFPCIGTISNVTFSYTDFDTRTFSPECADLQKDLSGRFYFLQVYADTTGMFSTARPEWGIGGYNYGRDYVLSTQIDANGAKTLVAVPKEKLMSTEKEYWLFPYDSVNMAAHWEVQAKGGDYKNGYILINMLGDTLQYNYDFTQSVATNDITNNRTNISGGYLTYNSLIPGANSPATYQGLRYFGRPSDIGDTWVNDQGYPNAGTQPAHWFDYNNNPFSWTGIQDNQTWFTWKFYQLESPYKFGLDAKSQQFPDSTFFMELAGPAGFTVGLDWTLPTGNVNGFVHGNGTGAVGSGANSYYWQRGLQLNVVDNSQFILDDCTPLPNCHGLMIKMQPISYVPTYGPFYPSDKTADNTNGKYNTNDRLFQKQDSLTAYSFLEGYYDLAEAQAVDNSLKLTYVNMSTNDGTKKANVARLWATTDTTQLQFIPLSGLIGAQRSDSIKALATSAGVTDNGIDTLYGEKYKWYIVKLGDNYLTFDTINVTAKPNRQKVGFVFAPSLTNATPIRLYQPLVGDKSQNNFLIQFYMPRYTYNPSATVNANKAIQNTFPDIESSDLTATTPGGLQVCFATLAGQTNYIIGMKAYTGTVPATRFHWSAQVKPVTCNPNFIDPQWLGAERLLNLPLFNHIWVGNDAVDAWFASYAVGSSTHGIVSNDTVAFPATTLKHTYVATINDNNVMNGRVNIPWGFKTGTWTLSGFQTNVPVPLYYIQNAEGLYLTVVPSTEMRSDDATASDVSGIRLEWQKKATDTQAFFDNYGYLTQTLQLFAINGCKDDSDGWYGKFVYLPLASYKANYKDGSIVQTTSGKTPEVNAAFFNTALGTGTVVDIVRSQQGTDSTVYTSDVTSCWRVSQWSATQLKYKDLIVFNSKNNNVNVVGLVPVEFKLSKAGYQKPWCASYLVQNKNDKTVGSLRGTYYTVQGSDSLKGLNTDYSLFAHWTINYADPTDTLLATFTPEVQWVYNDSVGSTAIPVHSLKGQYYFVKQLDVDTYQAIDVSGYNTGDFTPYIDTLKLTCANHDLPFFDLEKDGGFNLLQQLGVVETPFVDRTLGSVVSTDATTPTPIYDSNNNIIGYQTFMNQVVGKDINGAEYFNVYKENVRDLTANHIIPYYSFSITKKDAKGNDVEYFLNVDLQTTAVSWMSISDLQRDTLTAPATYPNDMKNFKFCLPYKQIQDEQGNWKFETVAFNDNDGITHNYNSVYLQTLDTAVTDYPWLVIAGAATKWVSSVNLKEAMLASDASLQPKTTTGGWNIYTVDYRNINPKAVTSWAFGGKVTKGNLWVPIAEIIDKVDSAKEGTLTVFDQDNMIGGFNFVTKAPDPATYGILTGKADNFTLIFKGDTTIGNYQVLPIWYYQIKYNDLYLTDATTTGTVYNFQNKNYAVAEFDNLSSTYPYAQYKDEGIFADKGFNQTFGFRYTSDETDADQIFYVVSNADYTQPHATVENGYRYLAQVNNRLIFVTDQADALAFQWGKLGSDGGYTDIQVVGQGGIFGVQGGVKFLNTTGTADIYSIDGRLIKSAVLTGSDQVVPAPRGIAIVKVGSKVVKVVIQ